MKNDFTKAAGIGFIGGLAALGVTFFLGVPLLLSAAICGAASGVAIARYGRSDKSPPPPGPGL